MNGLRKRKKLSTVQLFTFTQAIHTSSLIFSYAPKTHVKITRQWKSTFKGNLFRLKYRVFMIMILWPGLQLLSAYFIILNLAETIAKSDRSKEILTKQKKKRLEKSKFHKNGKFDFLTDCK